MRTLILSDLHLGARSQRDLLRRADVRAALLAAVADSERVVLLGDTLELRDGPQHEALALARPFFDELGAALGAGQVVLVAGNHDHALVAPWLARRGADGPAPPLGLAQRVPTSLSPLTAAIADWLGPAELAISHPGIWLRPDVYALHGHYLDRRITIPSLEHLGARAVERLLHDHPPDRDSVDGYEATLAPLYALLHGVAQGRLASGPAAPGTAPTSRGSIHAWQLLVGDGGRRPLLHRVAGTVGLPLAVATLNRLGFGPLSPRLSGVELRRAALRAIGAVIDGLGIDAGHVIFGHTHRAGPLPGDAPEEWRSAAGVALVNCGSWIYEPAFVAPSASAAGGAATPTPATSGQPSAQPYWPGRCVQLDATGPPRVHGLLDDWPVARLARAAQNRPR